MSRQEWEQRGKEEVEEKRGRGGVEGTLGRDRKARGRET